MSKKVYKKVSFIIPELDESGKGKISKEVYRKLVRYGKLPIGEEYKEIDGGRTYVNNELNPSSLVYKDEYGITILETIYLFVDGSIEVDESGVLVYVGDRIDIEIPFETGVTVEDKVDLMFKAFNEQNQEG